MKLLPWILTLANFSPSTFYIYGQDTNEENFTNLPTSTSFFLSQRTSIVNLTVQNVKNTKRGYCESPKEVIRQITPVLETSNRDIRIHNTALGNISVSNTETFVDDEEASNATLLISSTTPEMVEERTSTLQTTLKVTFGQQRFTGTSPISKISKLIIRNTREAIGIMDIKNITKFDHASETLNSTTEAIQIKKTTLESNSTLSMPPSHENTAKDLFKPRNSNQQNTTEISAVSCTLKKIHSIANTSLKTKTNRSPANNTTAKTKKSKNKQKSLPTETTTTSPISHTYTRYQMTGTIGEPITKEIDCRESNEFGEESFQTFMLKNRVFVDKSLLVKEFLEHDRQVILITRPRFWGKSTNLNMLGRFFQIEVDSQGTMVPEEAQINRRIFCGGQIFTNDSVVKTFQPLKICRVRSAMIQQGKHPVIKFNYQFLGDGDYRNLQLGMKSLAIKSFKRHFYLENYFKENPNLLDESETSHMERYRKRKLTEKDLIRSIRFLSELLYIYFNRRVIVLIDEYDTPLAAEFRRHSSNQSEDLTKVLQFYRSFYTESFKDNPFLEKGFVTGKLRIANSNLFVNLDNIAEYTLLDHQFNQFYGFTQQEVDELSKQVPERVSQEIKSYYKGYNYGSQMMYNPWSINQYLEKNYSLGSYWSNSGILLPANSKRYCLDAAKKDIENLLDGGYVQIAVNNEVSFDNLNDSRNFFNFILFTGYLSPSVKNPNGTYQLVKPNNETNKFFNILLENWIRVDHRTTGKPIKRIDELILSNDSSSDITLSNGHNSSISTIGAMPSSHYLAINNTNNYITTLLNLSSFVPM